MDPDVEEALQTERRAKLLNPNDPSIQELWAHIKTTVAKIAKPGIDIDQETEGILIPALLYAQKDQLSGISNRRGLLVDLEAAVEVAKRLGLTFTVLFGDGRKFKEANDTLGHPVGDRIISAIGKAMDQAARRALDIKFHEEGIGPDENEDPNIQVARQGGDEFAVVLFGTNLRGAGIVAEKMQQSIAELVNTEVPEYEETFNRPFSMTIGMAEFDPNLDETGLDVLKRADQNLTQVRQQMGEPRRS